YRGAQANEPAPNSWAAKNENEVAIWNIKVEPNMEYLLPSSNTLVTRTLYFYEGDEIHIRERKINPNFGIALDPSMEVSIKTGNKKAHLLLLQGRPIEEPIAKYGPFVMNTEEEIQQAMEEYRLTQFGGWPWPYPDNVHEKNKGRFALYPDGNLIEKTE
ncbi:MAG: pirin-like C-terminal cupin domain-containing protein, partial [Bacteroidota bacterium]